MSFFFILSGFVLAYSSSRSVKQPSCIEFVAGRIKKLYPKYLLSLMLALVFMSWNFSSVNVLPVILLVQSWFPEPSIYFGGNGPAWFLSDVLFFACVFPLVNRIVVSSSRPVLLRCSALLAAVYLCLVVFVPAEAVNWVLYIFPPVRLVDFIVGIVIFRCYRALSGNNLFRGPFIVNVVQILAVALEVLSIAVWWYLSERFSTTLLFFVPSGAMVLLFALTDSSEGILSKLLNSRPMIAFGGISFEVYLVHVPVIFLVRRIVGVSNPDVHPVIGLAATFGLTVVAAIATKRVGASLSRLWALATTKTR